MISATATALLIACPIAFKTISLTRLSCLKCHGMYDQRVVFFPKFSNTSTEQENDNTESKKEDATYIVKLPFILDERICSFIHLHILSVL